ncbi:TonB-dependent receptor domain-containing protein [Aquimarina sp. I32.4]|uniref:TonB-dependent receptor n=1 Tax=Aquimarina sp. I32.4 TaxID=2053903 RepID=UPI000CDE9CD1|nr:TonB-dependent receptor [Aquimarina sp. I32.4]
MKKFLLMFMLWAGTIAYAQSTFTGQITDSSNKPVPGAVISIRGTDIIASTDFDGFFTLEVNKPQFPVVIEIKSFGFKSQTTTIPSKDASGNILVTLEEDSKLDMVVVSASRAPERLFDSPVSIERFGRKDLANYDAMDYFDALKYLKGVDLNASSYNLKLLNTRGFSTLENTRFVHLIDGMDNTNPTLGSNLGDLSGINILDINSIEMVPGPSSALYGANAFNGSLFIASKNPFDHQGVSTYLKTGVTSQEAAGNNQFYDFGVRIAYAFSKKIAAKASLSYFQGTDWHADNTDNLVNAATDRTDPSYNGVNVYGDEVRFNLSNLSTALVDSGALTTVDAQFLPNQVVSRTGYNEVDLYDDKINTLRFNGAIHYKPFENDFEIIYNARINKGTSAFQNATRYIAKGAIMQQHKIEIKNDNFFLRGYITSGDAKKSYDAVFAGINLNRAWKSDDQWFADYSSAYVNAVRLGETTEQAHALSRTAADTGRLVPGTSEYQNAFNNVIGKTDLEGGARFIDKSLFKHADANYNFSHLTQDFADIQVGGSFREYELNSAGTIFTDFEKPIVYSEYGIYTQIQKKFADDRFKVTGSVRYDKSQLFDGNISPRVSLGYTLGERRNHNIRASYQTGFRNPTAQNLYIDLDVGQTVNVGSAPDNLDREERTYNLSSNGRSITGNNTATISGRQAYDNAYSLVSVTNRTPTAANNDVVAPEEIVAVELGYRGKINKITLDVSGYYNEYTNFISTENVLVPLYGNVNDVTGLSALSNNDVRQYQIYTNSGAAINSYGATVGVGTKILGGFDLDMNYTFAQLDFDESEDPNFRPGFNTPEHKAKVVFGHKKIFKNFGFNTAFRWSDSYLWQAPFGEGEIPSFSVIDAQLSYKIPGLKSTIKLGATNLGGKEYFTAIGPGAIGSVYYVNLLINNL